MCRQQVERECMKTSTKKMGRPFSENPKSDVINIRVTPQQKETIREMAKKKGMGITEYILYALKVK